MNKLFLVDLTILSFSEFLTGTSEYIKFIFTHRMDQSCTVSFPLCLNPSLSLLFYHNFVKGSTNMKSLSVNRSNCRGIFRVSGLWSQMDHVLDQSLSGPCGVSVTGKLCTWASGGARCRFVYVLKPTLRARQESPMSTPILKHRIPFHRDISHYCLLYFVSYSSVSLLK